MFAPNQLHCKTYHLMPWWFDLVACLLGYNKWSRRGKNAHYKPLPPEVSQKSLLVLTPVLTQVKQSSRDMLYFILDLGVGHWQIRQQLS